MKYLNVVQALSKVGKVLSKIVYICCIIGAVGCLVGCLVFAFLPEEALNADTEAYRKITEEAGMNFGSLTATLASAVVTCVAEAVLAAFTVRYFTHEITVGTPFSHNGAEELKKLGIRAIVIPFVGIVASSIVYTVINTVKAGDTPFKAENEVSIALGIMMIILSVVLKAAMEAGATSAD